MLFDLPCQTINICGDNNHLRDKIAVYTCRQIIGRIFNADRRKAQFGRAVKPLFAKHPFGCGA